MIFRSNRAMLITNYCILCGESTKPLIIIGQRALKKLIDVSVNKGDDLRNREQLGDIYRIHQIDLPSQLLSHRA
jgi:hypothetical protein